MFVPTNRSYQPGDEVFMLLNLMEEPEKIPVVGRSSGSHPEGPKATELQVLRQFSDQDNTARNKIETYLAGALKSDRPTHTITC